MQGWRLGFLGIETIPPWLGEFEVEQFFRLSPAEIATVKTRRGNDTQIGLGLHIGFLRMSGRVLNSTDVIHWRILAFLGAQLQIPAPRVSSLRALYPRRPTLHEHQKLAKAQLGFKNLIEPVRRQLVAHLRKTRGAATDADELLIGARQWLYEHNLLICVEIVHKGDIYLGGPIFRTYEIVHFRHVEINKLIVLAYPRDEFCFKRPILNLTIVSTRKQTLLIFYSPQNSIFNNSWLEYRISEPGILGDLFCFVRTT